MILAYAFLIAYIFYSLGFYARESLVFLEAWNSFSLAMYEAVGEARTSLGLPSYGAWF